MYSQEIIHTEKDSTGDYIRYIEYYRKGSRGLIKTKKETYKVVQNYIDSQVSDNEFNTNKNKINHNQPQLKESYYYRKVFETYYPNKSQIIPHFWMPKWTNCIDPSARELQ